MQPALIANADIPAYVARRVGEILEQEQLLRFLPEAPEYRLRTTVFVATS